MDNGMGERGPLSIPSFASDRCRSLTGALVRTLESVSPSDDVALEDRALACFVVACGELALMKDVGQRDAVVEQLTVVARKLVSAALATARNPQTAPDPEPAPEQRLVPELPGELTPHVGMTWEQVEAVLKQQKADRELR
jgi:hypothetical protein